MRNEVERAITFKISDRIIIHKRVLVTGIIIFVELQLLPKGSHVVLLNSIPLHYKEFCVAWTSCSSDVYRHGPPKEPPPLKEPPAIPSTDLSPDSQRSMQGHNPTVPTVEKNLVIIIVGLTEIW